MKILVATFRYLSLTGTETFTYTLLKCLKTKNLDLTFFSPFLEGEIFKKTKQLGIKTVSNLKDIVKEKFDLIHCQHNLTAILCRYHFPKTPMIYLQHGPKVFLEQAPEFIKFNYYGGISQEIVDLLKQKYPEDKVFYFPNSIDTDRFKPANYLPKQAKNILVIGSRFSKEAIQIIKQAATSLSLKIQFIKEDLWSIEEKVKQTDIVITLGRGAIESMSCGKVVIIFAKDNNLYNNGDGIISSQNIENVKYSNFSSRALNIPFSKANLIKQIKQYQAEMGNFNHQYAVNNFDINKNIKILLNIYQKTSRQKALAYDRKQVEFMTHGLELTLGFEKLIYRYRDFSKLLKARIKDQFLQ